MEKIRFIDLFCGIGGFRIAMDQACKENDIIPECVFSSDIDIPAKIVMRRILGIGRQAI